MPLMTNEPVVGHERNLAHVDFLLLHFLTTVCLGASLSMMISRTFARSGEQ